MGILDLLGLTAPNTEHSSTADLFFAEGSIDIGNIVSQGSKWPEQGTRQSSGPSLWEALYSAHSWEYWCGKA